jgi:polysaccharide deacetylase 2 family uncharacterized protein YibQ
MATVYKVEVEVTSHWVSFDEETMKQMIKEQLEDLDDQASKKGNEITIDKVEVKKIA